MLKAALYLRLSKEDVMAVNESESIANQKSMLTQYAAEQNFCIVGVYADDGFSGGNFNRPGFQKMLADIEHKKINTVITKDAKEMLATYFFAQLWF